MKRNWNGDQVDWGLNFTERGFGVRGAKGVNDRGHTAIIIITKSGDEQLKRSINIHFGCRDMFEDGIK